MTGKKARTSYFEGFRLYPFSVAGHIAQGAAAGVGLVSGSVTVIVLAGVWTALYVAYQGLSVLRKSDSPGLDIADYMTGVALGAIGAWLASLAGVAPWTGAEMP